MIRKDKNKVKMSGKSDGDGEGVDVIDTFEDLTVEAEEEPEVKPEAPKAAPPPSDDNDMPQIDGDLDIDEGDVFNMNISPKAPPPPPKQPPSGENASENSENPENLPATASQVPARMDPQQQQGHGRELKTYATDITQAPAGGGEDDGGSIRKKGRIGDRLVEMGLITNDQLNVALQEKKISGKMLG